MIKAVVLLLAVGLVSSQTLPVNVSGLLSDINSLLAQVPTAGPALPAVVSKLEQDLNELDILLPDLLTGLTNNATLGSSLSQLSQMASVLTSAQPILLNVTGSAESTVAPLFFRIQTLDTSLTSEITATLSIVPLNDLLGLITSLGSSLSTAGQGQVPEVVSELSSVVSGIADQLRILLVEASNPLTGGTAVPQLKNIRTTLTGLLGQLQGVPGDAASSLRNQITSLLVQIPSSL